MAVIGKHIDLYPQSLKGLCIICVVLVHLPWGQDGEWTAWVWLAARKVINFAVATFFFLSAYYTKSYTQLCRNGLKLYYKRRFKRILIPYLIWASVYTFLIPIFTTGEIPHNWLYFLITGKGPTYFLLALAQFTLINPILQKHKKKTWFNIIFLAVTPMYISFYYGYNIINGEEFKPEQFFCFPWFICYYLGLLMQDYSFSSKITNQSVIQVLAVCVALLLISIIESAIIYHVTGIYSFAISQITAGSIIYSIGMIILFKTLWIDNKNINRNWLSNLGDFSMGIFLIHPTFNWIFKYIAIHLPFGAYIYSSSIGFIFIHLIILILSVLASYNTSKSIYYRFPSLATTLGLK